MNFSTFKSRTSNRGRVLSDFDYVLPKEKIALHPLSDRAAAKMLVVSRNSETVEHRTFRNLPDYLKAGDVLVLNNTRVLPARLYGHRFTGSKVEILLLREMEKTPGSCVWEALLKPSGKIKKGEVFEVGQDDYWVQAHVLTHPEKDSGKRLLKFEVPDFEKVLEKIGHMPLPPYINRMDEISDREEYQTVFAEKTGSVAAPTAGLHFDQRLLDEIKSKGIEIAEVTLNVGYGTFQLMLADQVADHKMAAETYEISEKAAHVINRAKTEGRRVVACGTTSVRTLESSADASGKVHAGRTETNLFIHSPYRFKVVDALITNFHFPRTSLLVLVSAFVGYEKTMQAYQFALESDYRFASYGDGMFIF